MSYRDPLQAALVRLQQLERELDQRRQHSEASQRELSQLQRELSQARQEVRRLRAELPGSAAHTRRPFLTAPLVALGLAVATGVAGYHSETMGVTMSYLVSLPLGLGLGGLLGALRSRRRGWIMGAAGALLLPLGLLLFYALIWPEL